MGFALLKRESSDDAAGETTGGVTFKDRFHAWWNGYELRPTSPDSEPDHARAPEDDTETPDGMDEVETGSDSGAAGDDGDWSETRRQLAQEIWSPGFVVPGGNDYVEKLVSGCSLTEAETMLEIGVGMGGGTRTIIGKFGNYVTGYERDPELAAAAVRHAVTYEIDDKLEVVSKSFEELDLKKSYYRAALMRDILYTIEDKAGMLTKMADSLKSGESYLVITDFFFDADDESPELAAWKAIEERPVYPYTEGEIIKCLESSGVQLRMVENEGDDYRAMVVAAWAEYLKSVQGQEVSDEMGREMAREGEFWATRSAAIESGALTYYRIEGIKIT